MKLFRFLLYTIVIVLASVAISYAIFNQPKPSYNATDKVFHKDYRIVAPPVPEDANFAGELMPLDNFEVFERLEREFIVNTYWHSNSILFLKRAARWFPVIEPILDKNGIPDDFKYVCMIESNLTNAISPANAVGFWQFLKSTGKRYGLEINSNVDERYHVEKATEAACKYLLDAYEEFGNWTLAAASYNMGIEGVKKQIRRQKTNNYYNLVLSNETSRYIPRTVATKYMMENPEKFGFYISEMEKYQPYSYFNVPVDMPVKDLADFAHKYGINYKILKMLNPWLRDNYLKNRSRKEYLIKIPVVGSIKVIEDL